MKVIASLFWITSLFSAGEAKAVHEDTSRTLIEENIQITCGMYDQRCCKGKFCAPFDPSAGPHGGYFLTCNAMQQCVRCGERGEFCCDNEECGKGFVCDRGICVTCGHEDAPCCEGMKCRSGYACVGDSVCKPCGHDGDVCCEGMKCNTGNVCLENNECASCGGPSEPCCDGMKCGMGLSCNFEQECEECGGAGEPCCPGMKCDSDGPPLVCTAEGCMECGDEDEPCCDGEGPPCGKTDITCDDESVSVPLKCGSDGFCEVPDHFPHTK